MEINKVKQNREEQLIIKNYKNNWLYCIIGNIFQQNLTDFFMDYRKVGIISIFWAHSKVWSFLVCFLIRKNDSCEKTKAKNIVDFILFVKESMCSLNSKRFQFTGNVLLLSTYKLPYNDFVTRIVLLGSIYKNKLPNLDLYILPSNPIHATQLACTS